MSELNMVERFVFGSPTAEEAAPARNVIGGEGDEKAQHGEQVRHLSLTVEEANSDGNVICGAGDEQAQCGG